MDPHFYNLLYHSLLQNRQWLADPFLAGDREVIQETITHLENEINKFKREQFYHDPHSDHDLVKVGMVIL